MDDSTDKDTSHILLSSTVLAIQWKYAAGVTHTHPPTHIFPGLLYPTHSEYSRNVPEHDLLRHMFAKAQLFPEQYQPEDRQTSKGSQTTPFFIKCMYISMELMQSMNVSMTLSDLQ